MNAFSPEAMPIAIVGGGPVGLAAAVAKELDQEGCGCGVAA